MTCQDIDGGATEADGGATEADGGATEADGGASAPVGPSVATPLRGDMIFVYQLFHIFFNIDMSAFFIPATITTTRGHNYKLFKFSYPLFSKNQFLQQSRD